MPRPAYTQKAIAKPPAVVKTTRSGQLYFVSLPTGKSTDELLDWLEQVVNELPSLQQRRLLIVVHRLIEQLK